MANLLDSIGSLLSAQWKAITSGPEALSPRHSRTYRCRCGNHVFFRNSQCLKCQTPLGYLPHAALMLPLAPGPRPDTWLADGRDELFAFCGNRVLAAGCNWLKAADDPNPRCIACRLNRTIPDLDHEENARFWRLIEFAKRRLVSQLLALGLPVKSRVDEDAERGVAFDFLRSPPEGPRVLTGHADGLITLNIEEADDARRERLRLDLHEPYRTLLGHLRHEIGHYYWDRLVRDGPWLEPFRRVFGDERADYAAALKANYEHGPPPAWRDRHISAYASTHPWEDWAETWAHYLHLVDSLGTALGFGLNADDLDSEFEPYGHDALYDPDDADADRFLDLLNSWIEMTMVLNELARSMGQPDFYPFVTSKPVVAKLQFVHLVVRAGADEATPVD
jgi:hypothetical protein